MVIKVISFIPYVENISRHYFLEKPQSIASFTDSLGIQWDEDALVVINRVICNDKETLLSDGDVVELLIPISGG